MNRDAIENVLMEMGVPVSILGFTYISDAIEYIDKYGEDISATKELYPEIEKKRNTTPSRVERAIRHAFEVVRSLRGNYETVEKYIGFMNCSNFSSLIMLYKRIKQDCENRNTEMVNKENVHQKNNAGITDSEIREIFRQELREFIKELKELQI